MPIINHSHAPEVPWRPGYRKWDIAGHEQGVSSTLSINTAEPGTGAPLHTHTVDELIVILEGTLEVSLDGHTHTVGRDHTVVIPPGAEHAFHVTGEDTAHLLVFFPALDPYSAEHTRYIEGSRPGGVAAGVVRDGGVWWRAGGPFDRLRANGVVKGGWPARRPGEFLRAQLKSCHWT